MAEPLAVLTADWHLSERAWAYRPIGGDSYWALEQIVSRAIELDVPLIGAGDLLEKQVNSSEPVVQLSQQLRRLADGGQKLLFIQGNHDLRDAPWPAIAGNAAHHIHETTWVLANGLRLYGLDYQPMARLPEALAAVPEGTDLLVCHQGWVEFMGNIGCPQGSLADISQAAAVFSGDYHVYEERTLRNVQGRDLLAISPGATYQTKIDEPSEHGLVVLYDDFTFQRELLRSRPFLKWSNLILEADLEQFVATAPARLESLWGGEDLPAELRKPLVRVIYHHSLRDCRRRVTTAVGERAHLFWKELAEERPALSLSEVKAAAAGVEDQILTLDSALEGFLAQQELRHLLGDCRRLLAAQDVAAELQRMRAEVLECPSNSSAPVTEEAAADPFAA